MAGLRPSYWSPQYSNLSHSERVVQSERDALLWDQAEELKKLNDTLNLQNNISMPSSDHSADYRYLYDEEWHKYVPEKLRNKFYQLDNFTYLTEKLGDIAYAENRLSIKQGLYTDERLKYLKSSSAKEWTFIGVIWTLLAIFFIISMVDINYLLAFAVTIIVNLCFVLAHMQNVHKSKLEQIYCKEQLTQLKKDKEALLKEFKVAVDKIR